MGEVEIGKVEIGKAETYQAYIQQLLTCRAERSRQSASQSLSPSSSQVEARTNFDMQRDHYQLVYVGCEAQWPARLPLSTAFRY